MELIKQLTEHLGVTEDQAKGGAGLIFSMAKDKLGSADFGKVSESIPETGDLIKNAPSGGLSGAVGGLASSVLGKKGDDVGAMTGLVSGFSNLGLDAGMVTKFIPVVLNFVQSRGGDMAKGMLQRVLK